MGRSALKEKTRGYLQFSFRRPIITLSQSRSLRVGLQKGPQCVPTGSCGTDEKHRLRCRLRIPLLHDECNTGLPGAARSRAQARRRAAVRGPFASFMRQRQNKGGFFMSAFQSTFDSLRGFPRRLSDAAREVRRTASLAGAAMLRR